MKKSFALISLLVFSLVACQSADAPVNVDEERLNQAVTLIEAAQPMGPLTIDLDQTTLKDAAVKSAVEGLPGFSALNVNVSVRFTSGQNFEVTLSRGSQVKTTPVNVSAFTLSDDDFAAAVAAAIALIEGYENFVELEITADSEEAKAAALIEYLGAIPGLPEKNVTLSASFDETQWSYQITVSRANVSEQTYFGSVFFMVVRPITDPTLNAMVSAVKAHFGDQYNPSFSIGEQQLSELYGINMDAVEDFYAQGPIFTMSVDMMIGLKALPGRVAELETAMLAYQQYLINDSFQYPMNMPIVQASKVHVVGDYVFLIVLSQFPVPEETEDYVAFYESINQEAIDQINAAFAAQ